MQQIIINELEVIMKLTCNALRMKESPTRRSLEILEELRSSSVLNGYKGSPLALVGAIIHAASILEDDERSMSKVAGLLEKRISTISDNLKFIVRVLDVDVPASGEQVAQA